MKNLFSLGVISVAMCMVSCSSAKVDRKPLAERVDLRDYPSAFMAWYNIDMPEYPVDTEENRIKACAKHDLMWEEPLSQLGEGVDLILGLTWNHKYHGLATEFTKESLSHALENRRRLQELNPNMVCLFEVRWRDAPMSFLPEDSDWWLRDENGNIKKGWLGGWEPFYLLDYKNEGLLGNIARQAKIAVECGVYDGIMLDWSGNLEVIKRIRKAIGKDKLIIDKEKNEMMACTRKGLSRFILQGTDSDIKKVVSYGVDLKNSHSLSNNFLACIDKQNDSIYWVGTLGGGLNRLVIQGDTDNAYTATSYMTQDGMMSNDAEIVMVDKNENVWIGGYGIMKLDTHTGILSRFDHLDGLQGNFFKYGAGYKGKDGMMYMGGNRRFELFLSKPCSDWK